MGAAMQVEELDRRLARLLPGESVLLNGAQFRRAFDASADLEEQKAAATEPANQHNCSVQFIGLEHGYAVFARLRNHRPEPSSPLPLAN
jgi:hypothetical protein